MLFYTGLGCDFFRDWKFYSLSGRLTFRLPRFNVDKKISYPSTLLIAIESPKPTGFCRISRFRMLDPSRFAKFGGGGGSEVFRVEGCLG